MDGARALFRKGNVGLDGNIKTEEIGAFMNAAGLSPSPGEVLNAHRTLDPRNTGLVVFSDLETWLSDQCLPHHDSKFNRLLIKPVVGKGKRPSYDVPGNAHTYGQPVVRDKVSGAQLIFNWAQSQPSKSSDAYVDRVKMNRQAVKKGCITAKDFVRHSQTDRVYTYIKQAPRPAVPIDTTLAFGQKPMRARARQQPTMQDLITAKYNDAMFEEEKEYPTTTAQNVTRPAQADPGVAGKAPFGTTAPTITRKVGTTLRHTKASKMQAEKVRQDLAPVEKKVFTLKQFRNVGPRVSTRRATGNNIVGNLGY